jgi:TonB family protein
MVKRNFATRCGKSRFSGSGWLKAAAMALLVVVAVSARANEDRAIKSRVSPIYPELAKRMRITGLVKVEATVDSDGKVTAVKTLSGSRVLSPAAEEAVSKWRYAPASAASTVDVEINFALGQ